MISIRPNQLFQLLNQSDEPIWFQIPNRGGLMTLESLILVSLIKIINAKNVFEFGTYEGFTTRLMIENLPKSGTVTTIDIDSVDGVIFEGVDEKLAKKSLESIREYSFSNRRGQVEQIIMNTMEFSIDGREGKFDMVFVDANHHVKYAERDTENSFKLIGEKGCIVWHDYKNPNYPSLTDFLDN